MNVPAVRHSATTRRAKRKPASRPAAATRRKPPEINSHWTFLSNHGYVLACLARDPDVRLRDVAQSLVRI